MRLHLDVVSSVPPYEQVRAGILALIESGELRPEQRLPTVRALAGELELAANTVARAYRELESAGYIETRGRNGTVVLAQASQQLRQARSAAAQYVRRMRDLGCGREQTVALVRRELELD